MTNGKNYKKNRRKNSKNFKKYGEFAIFACQMKSLPEIMDFYLNFRNAEKLTRGRLVFSPTHSYVPIFV
jgi:hypothetical protein